MFERENQGIFFINVLAVKSIVSWTNACIAWKKKYKVIKEDFPYILAYESSFFGQFYYLRFVWDCEFWSNNLLLANLSLWNYVFSM